MISFIEFILLIKAERHYNIPLYWFYGKKMALD